jgi:uncharacterized protein YndB with AHSA1/START domain
MIMTDDRREPLSVSRLIKASPQTIYRALLDPAALAVWRAPEGMKATVEVFEPRVGGAFRMSLEYTSPVHASPGKTTEHSDVARGRFRELVPDRRVVEEVEFESDDPAMAGTMVLTTTLTPVAGGTEITIACQNAPKGIDPRDHEIGIISTLKNLAAFVAQQRN